MLAGREIFSVGNIHPRFEVVEIDAGKRLIHMQLARLAIQTKTVPIKNPVGSVRVLLDLVNEKTRADRVEPS